MNLCCVFILFKFENLASILKLPGKKTFNNMDRDFLEKRKKDLNAYLQVTVTSHY